MATIDPELLQLLVCSLSKADLIQHHDSLVSTDRETRRSYAIIEGIPDMLIEHSRVLELSEWEKIMGSLGK